MGPLPRGPHGLLQPLADGVKFLFKEDMTPAGVDKFVYFLAPFLMALSLAMTSIAMIPFGPTQIALFGQATPSGDREPEYRVAGAVRDYLDGRLWRGAGRLVVQQQISASGRAAQLGADGQLRTGANHVGCGRAADGGHLQLAAISSSVQSDSRQPRLLAAWNLSFPQILGFLCFFIAAVAETNRVPFDLAGSRIGTGRPASTRNIRASSSRCFSSREYASMITVSCLCDDSVFRRMAVSLPHRLDVHTLYSVADFDSVRFVGHLGRHPIRNDFLPLMRRVERFVVRVGRRQRFLRSSRLVQIVDDARLERHRLLLRRRLRHGRGDRRRRRLDVRRLLSWHRLIDVVRGAIGLGRGVTETLGLGHRSAKATQALVRQRGTRLLRTSPPLAFDGFGLDLADRLFQRQPLAGDVGFVRAPVRRCATG